MKAILDALLDALKVESVVKTHAFKTVAEECREFDTYLNGGEDDGSN
jgi:hypothetical protein